MTAGGSYPPIPTRIARSTPCPAINFPAEPTFFARDERSASEEERTRLGVEACSRRLCVVPRMGNR
jgi:hypothetical protein